MKSGHGMREGWWTRATRWLRSSAQKSGDWNPWELIWADGYRSAAGAMVNAQTLLSVVAAWSCIRNISEDLGKVPLILYERAGDDGKAKRRAINAPLYGLLHDAPNEWQTSIEFREMQQATLLTRGDAYAFKVRSRLDGEVLELIPLQYERVRVDRLANGAPVYHYQPPGTGEARTYSADEVWHLRGLSLDGLHGVSVLRHHADSAFGAALALQDHANAILENRARASGVLEHPGKLSDQAYSHLQSSFSAAISGKNLGKVAIAEEGMKYNQISMTPEDIQLVEQRKFTRTEIAAIFRMPPHKIGDLERATYTNIEHQSLEYVTDTLLPWARRWEQSITKHLLAGSRDVYAEFLFDSLLRGDTATRYRAYATARQWGWLSVNDILELENRNGIGPGGDVYLQPSNMVDTDNPPDPEGRRGED